MDIKMSQQVPESAELLQPLEVPAGSLEQSCPVETSCQGSQLTTTGSSSVYWPQTHSRGPSPLNNGASDDGEESSSCLSTSSINNTSTTLRDVSTNGSSDNINLLQESDQAQRTKAVFDRVILDAMQRQHIRTKHMHPNTEYDTESDSWSETEGTKQKMSDNKTRSDKKHPHSHLPAPKRQRLTDSGLSSEHVESTISDLHHNNQRQTSQTANVVRSHGHPKRIHHRIPGKPHRLMTVEPVDDSSSSSSSGSGGDEERHDKQRRFFRTFTALRECGLMDISLQTATLMEKNRKIQESIAVLKEETEATYRQLVSLCKANPTFGERTQTQETMKNLHEILSKDGNRDMGILDQGHERLASVQEQ